MKQEFIIQITEDQANKLQTLGLKVDSKAFLIEKMFTNHMDDTPQLFESLPYKMLTQEYEIAYSEWEQAKRELEQTYLIPKIKEVTGINTTNFNWNINDYQSLECKVTLLD